MRKRKRGQGRAGGAAVGWLAILLAAACSGPPATHVAWTKTFPIAHDVPWHVAVLSPDGGDRYQVSHPTGQLDIAASAANSGNDLREVIWPGGGPAVADSQSCATWTSASSDRSQQGLAFRIVSRPSFTRAITVTKNVEYGLPWIFNVHTWDSADTLAPFTQVAQFDLSAVLLRGGALRPFPWRVCARATGRTLTLKIWFPARMQEPSWADKTYVRSTSAIPDDYADPGETGWYVGHIPPGGTVSYTDLATWLATRSGD